MTREQLSSLMGIVKRINSTSALTENLSPIMEEAKELIKSKSSSLMLIDVATNELYFTVVSGEKGDVLREIRFPSNMGVAGLVATSGKGIIINDAENDSRVFKGVDKKTNMVTRNLIAVPLVVKDKVLGVLEVVNKIGENGYTKEDLKLFQAFAEFAALAINNTELFHNMKRKAHETNALYQLSEAINYCQTIDELMDKNIAVVCEVMDAKRVSIIIKKDDEFQFEAGAGISKEVLKHGKVNMSNNVLSFVLQEGNSVCSVNMDEDKRFQNRTKSHVYHSGSFVVSPLKLKGDIIGFLSVTERNTNMPYNQNDLRLLEMLAQQISENYNNMMLSQEAEKKKKIEMELSIAADLQQEILPGDFDSDGRLDIAARSIPAKQVGGDFYDYIPLGHGKFAIIIGDVSGKGLPAGIFMAISRSILRVYLLEKHSPSKALELSNRHICNDSKSGMFVTIFCCLVDTINNEITYSNAGHCEQYLINNKAEEITPLYIRNIPLGVMLDRCYSERKTKFRDGDVLVLYTDGITEAINKKEEMYGEARLKTCLKGAQNKNSQDIMNNVLNDVNQFVGKTVQFDDITILVVKPKAKL